MPSDPITPTTPSRFDRTARPSAGAGAESGPVARAPLGLLLATSAVIFLANAGLLVLQLLAGRYLAPFVGSSVETWTSVIGVFLTGIALGNWVGGRVADRYPSTRTLALLLVLGAVSCLTPMVGALVCEKTGLHGSLALSPRIPVLAALFCLPPATLLSMITPLVIKLAMADVRRAGRVAGLNFALSTLGCLLGNYLTGFWLMANYPLDSISLGVAGLLAVLALLQAAANRLGHEPPLHRVSDEPPSLAPGAEPVAADRGLDLRKDIRRAYAIVFVASFCGMSLELTGSRVLAPILGVSLYTWTGIIGVMLAGTAVGNYLGGVLADRGVGAALQRLAVVGCGLVGVFCAGPAVAAVRPPGALGSEQGLWTARGAGLAAGVMVACLGVWLGQRRWGRWLNVFAVGGVVGTVLSHTVARRLATLAAGAFDPDAEGLGKIVHMLARHEDIGHYGWVVHAAGFILGGLLLVTLFPPRESGNRRAGGAEALAGSLLVAGLATVCVVILLGLFSHFEFMKELALVDRIMAYTFALFFVPMLALGTVSPQVIRLSVTDVRHAGRTAGSIYAWSTVGAIAGTFATGYFLIGSVGTLSVLLLIALVAAALAFAVGSLWESPVMLFGVSIAAGAVVLGLVIKGGTKIAGRDFDFDLETKYYAIKVSKPKENDDGRRTLQLDLLLHSYVDLNDPTYLGYKHEQVQGELLRLADARDQAADKPTNLLVIGGGGYTFPRWAESQVPRANVEVVEIDPGVTRIAHEKLGLPWDTHIRSIHMDGRQYVAEKAPRGHYQLVVQDAVNDLSVPYHLLTREYDEAVKSLLTPDGAFLLTLIDELPNGKLWRAAAHTMRTVFPHVYLMSASDIGVNNRGRAVYILYGSMQPLELTRFDGSDPRAQEPDRNQDLVPVAVRKYFEARYAVLPTLASGCAAATDWTPWTRVMAPDDFDRLLTSKPDGEPIPRIVLTDQYAPVDNLMGDVFRAR